MYSSPGTPTPTGCPFLSSTYSRTFSMGPPSTGRSRSSVMGHTVASTVHSVGPYTLKARTAREAPSRRHNVSEMASPPTSTVTGRVASSSQPVSTSNWSCEGVQSSTSTRWRSR